jgi:hypothetical protein
VENCFLLTPHNFIQERMLGGDDATPLLHSASAATVPATTGPVPFRIYVVSVGFTMLFLAYNSLQVRVPEGDTTTTCALPLYQVIVHVI